MRKKTFLTSELTSVKLRTLRQSKNKTIISQYSAVAVLSGVSNVDNATDMVLLNICTAYFTVITENGIG